jgi:hypothetical protein
MKTVRIKKDKSTPEKNNFWTSAEAAIEEIKGWPEWKQNYVSPLLLGEAQSKTTDSNKPARKRK